MKKLIVQGFQSHKESKLNLADGLNVIVGHSDKGKSALVRALRWLFFNKSPKGTFKNYHTKEVSVTGVFNNAEVTRVRSDSKNQYSINDTPKKALRASVPAEVEKIFGLSDISFQPQYQMFFLFSDSPGQVAKQLNEVAGLKVMDDMMKDLNSQARSLSQREINLTEEHGNIEDEIKSLDWLDNCDEALSKVESIEDNLSSRITAHAVLTDILEQWTNVQEQKSELPSTEALPAVKEILEVVGDLTQVKKLSAEIGKILGQLEGVDAVRKTLAPFMKLDHKEVDKLTDDLAQKQAEIDILGGLLEEADELGNKREECNSIYQFRLSEYGIALAKIDICPLCGMEPDNA